MSRADPPHPAEAGLNEQRHVPATADFATVEAIFAEAVELDVDARARLLDDACRHRPDLRREVETLLAAHDRMAAVAPSGDEGPPEIGAGSRLGAYRLVEKIGEGGMGEVYRAERADGVFAQQVAVKITRSAIGRIDVLRRFKIERQILASLNHPNIVTLLDGGAAADGHAYLVMEYVSGVSLTRHCRERASSLEERLRIFQVVCGAVQYAHQHAIVHRDLKPANIVITAEGVPKVLDFGVAKLLEGQGEAGATTIGLLPGPLTPNYASPEQLRGLPVTTASDVYALGVLLYELVAGVRPYETHGVTLDRMLEIVMHTEPARPSAVRDEPLPSALPYARVRLRGDLDAIVMKAMSKEPAARYDSAGALASDLTRFLGGEPVLARAPSAGYVLRRLAARNKTLVAVTTLALVGILGTSGFALWQRQAARRAQARAEQRFREVRQLANALIFKIHDAVEPLAGSTPVRRTIVDEALAYLERLAQESAGDTALELELARAYARIGKVQGSPNEANLGDAAGAARSYERAIGLLRPAATGPEAPRDVAVAFGNILLDRLFVPYPPGSEALPMAQRALGYAQDLLRRAPDDWRVQQLVARANYVTAINLDPPESFPYLERAAELFGASLQKDPTRGDAVSAVASVERLFGAHYAVLADYRRALPHHLRARELAEPGLLRAPHDRRAQSTLADDLANIGDAYSLGEPKDLRQAVLVYEQARRIRQELATTDPRNVYAQQSVGWVLASLARVHAELGRPAVALDLLERAVSVDRQYPLTGSIGHRLNLASAWLAVGETSVRQGLRRQACRAFRASLADFTAAAPELFADISTLPHLKDPMERARRGVAGCAAAEPGPSRLPR